MNEVLEFLQTRNSAPRLSEPAPSDEQLTEMLRAALRAPDHAWLRPSRFIVIRGERRTALGELLESCLLQRNPAADAAAREKARSSPLRAPLVIVSVVSITEHPKVPPIEQRLSAGCATHALLLAAEALGFAAIWRTGDAAFDREVMRGLGLAEHEEIIGIVYVGTRAGTAKSIPEPAPADFVSYW